MKKPTPTAFGKKTKNYVWTKRHNYYMRIAGAQWYSNDKSNMAPVPTLRRWNSILGKDAIVCSLAKANSPKVPNRNLSIREDGNLKDSIALQKDIAAESGKFFRTLELSKPPTMEPQSIRANSLPKVAAANQFPKAHVRRSMPESNSNLKREENIEKRKNKSTYHLQTKTEDESKYFRSSSEDGPARRRLKDTITHHNNRKYLRSSEQFRVQTRRKFVHGTSKPTLLIKYQRNESVRKLAARSFDYNDADLSFQMSPAGPIVMGGTKEKLISLLSDITVIEIRYISEFLGVYPYFATCSQVLNSLNQAYHEPKIPVGLLGAACKEFVKKIKRRVLFVFTRWLQNYSRQFYDYGCVDELRVVLEGFDDCPEKALVVDLYQSKVLSCGESFDFLTPRIITDKTKSPLFTRKPIVIAQQLCILDQKQFFQIEVQELKDQSWNGVDSFEKAPNTTRCIEYFNRISYWCATEILSQQNLKQRVKKCMEFQNYNTLFAIISSLSFSSITRLKVTWKALPSKYTEMHEEMKEICCVEKHYLPYKKLIETQTPPLVPYLGVFLRDLTFIEVGNSSYLDDERTMINYDKFRMLAAVLEDIRKYQQIPYDFEVQNDVQTSLRISMLTLDEDELFNLSRIVEPPLPNKPKRGSTAFITRLKR